MKLPYSISRVNEINDLWMRKTKILLVLLFISFFFVVLDDQVGILNGLVDFVGGHVPMIRGLVPSGVRAGYLAARYFSLMAILLPLYIIWVLVEDDVVCRCGYGWSRMKGGVTRVLGFVYFIGLPLMIFVIYLALSAPFGYPNNPGNFGQTIFYWMLNSEVGLLVLGGFFGMCFGWVLLFVCWSILLPVVLLLRRFDFFRI